MPCTIKLATNCLILTFATGAVAYSELLQAQGYPEKPVRIVVPFSPGGGVDFVARAIGAKLRDSLKQAVIVDNRPGAGGSIAAALVAKAAPDGHTILLGSAALAVNSSLQKTVPYNLINDFSPVSLLTSSPQLLVVHPSVPARSVSQLIALAKSKPGKLMFASAGNGGAPHLAAELFKLRAGIDMQHIPYKGGGSAMVDLLGGQVDLYFSSVTGALPQIKAGKLRALGVTSAHRLASIPDVPTVAEAALPNYQAGNWYAFFVPTGTPADIVERLSRETIAALNSPELKTQFPSRGYEIIGSTPSELGTFVRDEIAKYARLIKEARITAQ